MSEEKDTSLDAAKAALKKAQRSVASESDNKERKADRGKSGGTKSFPGPKVIGKLLRTLDVIWNDWARPVTRFLKPITGRIWRFYHWSYQKFAHVKCEDDTRTFSSKRAAVVTLALAIITILTPVILVKHVVPGIARTTYDAVMLTTLKEDRLYLSRAELINPDRNMYQVTGCRDLSNCKGGVNTTYYRLRDNIILDIQYWVTRFEPYDPAEIAGAMVSELNDCSIKYYGRRSKALGWYPYIISASCVPASRLPTTP